MAAIPPRCLRPSLVPPLLADEHATSADDGHEPDDLDDPVTVHSTDITMGQAFDQAIQDLDRVIDRHFAKQRTLLVERESAKHWVASIDGNVLYRSPNRHAVQRFADTFASRTPGVTVAHPDDGFSVRVPDNVVALPVRAEA